jgi:hypothetical protein
MFADNDRFRQPRGGPLPSSSLDIRPPRAAHEGEETTMPRREKTFGLLVLLTGLLVFWAHPHTAAAGRRARARAESAKKKKAKALFRKAEKAYNLAQFETALELYSKAYETLPMPGFLFNIGQCHRMLKNFEKAIFFYKGYLRGGRNIPNRKLVVELIRKAEAKLRKQNDSPKTTQKVARDAEAGRSEKKKVDLDVKPEQSGGSKGPADDEGAKVGYLPGNKDRQDEPSSAVYEKWWFWTAISAGVAVVAAAVAGGVIAADSGSSTALPSGTLGTLDRR